MGWGGNDSLSGGMGNDTLISGGGDCLVVGGQGSDRLIGALGADHFAYRSVGESGLHAGSDLIVNFDADDDVIVLSAIGSGVAGGAFTCRGAAAFTAAGQVRTVESGGMTYVLLNLLGPTTAEMAVRLAGVVAADLGALNFVLQAVTLPVSARRDRPRHPRPLWAT